MLPAHTINKWGSESAISVSSHAASTLGGCQDPHEQAEVLVALTERTGAVVTAEPLVGVVAAFAEAGRVLGYLGAVGDHGEGGGVLVVAPGHLGGIDVAAGRPRRWRR